jgi:hypothetical protein
MTRAKRYMARLLTVLLVAWGTAACDELGGDNAINEVLPGTWTFSYETTDEIELEFEYELIVFNSDGTCSISYDGGAELGYYRAGDVTVVIEADKAKDPMVWKVLSFSPYQIVAEYEFDMNGRSVLATITLEKV